MTHAFYDPGEFIRREKQSLIVCLPLIVPVNGTTDIVTVSMSLESALVLPTVFAVSDEVWGLIEREHLTQKKFPKTIKV